MQCLARRDLRAPDAPERRSRGETEAAQTQREKSYRVETKLIYLSSPREERDKQVKDTERALYRSYAKNYISGLERKVEKSRKRGKDEARDLPK